MTNSNKSINLTQNAVLLLVVCFIGLIANHIYGFTAANKASLSFVQSIIGLFVFVGTYLGSVIIAQFVLKSTGQI